MRFIKDILLFDLETSGPDLDKDSVLQFGAVLLDKENLLEKAYYTTYIRNSLLQETLKAHAIAARVDISVLQKAPKPLDFFKELTSRFSGDVTLAVSGVQKLLFLRQAFRKSNNPFPFDLSVLDLWTVHYTYSMRMGLRKIPTLQTLAEHFHLTLTNPYDVFERTKLQAEVLRRVLREL